MKLSDSTTSLRSINIKRKDKGYKKIPFSIIKRSDSSYSDEVDAFNESFATEEWALRQVSDAIEDFQSTLSFDAR